LLWDPEHPNLYTLTVTLSSGETIQQRIGFKRIEVRGNQLLVNNMPVKLHGGCRHETHPTRGGLRIGKQLPERRPGEPYDPQVEWDRDGQYFHYLTKWMHALDQASSRTRSSAR
jgi:hypothetical protein